MNHQAQALVVRLSNILDTFQRIMFMGDLDKEDFQLYRVWSREVEKAMEGLRTGGQAAEEEAEEVCGKYEG